MRQRKLPPINLSLLRILQTVLYPNNPLIVCYMNSLLQQLFMNPMFCKGIMEAETLGQISKGNLVYQLQLLFAILKEKNIGTYNATHLCQIIKDFNGKPLSIKEQRDIDEFFNLLLDRLELFLKNAGKGSLLQETFGGSFANGIICMECPHRSEKIDSFLSLNLQIAGKRHVEESLRGFIEEEYLTGKDAYYCERCDRKMKAKRRTTFKVLPNYLVVFLKRFDYQPHTG